MRKALVVATIAEFITSFEIQDICILQEKGYEVHCAANFDTISTEKRKILEEKKVVCHDIPFSRKPFRANNIEAFKQLKRSIKENGFDLVHCHTPVGGALTRIACLSLRKKERPFIIYTAHGFHFYKGASLKGWCLYYPVEWLLSWCTDILITINDEDYQLATKKLHAQKSVYVPGIGIDLQKFSSEGTNSNTVREALGVKPDEVMAISVGELCERKNQLQAVRAIHALQNDLVKYFIIGEGALRGQLMEEISALSMKDNIVLLGYRSDIPELCTAADLFLFPSLQEGLPVALMEAIACKVPVVCSNIRGNRDVVAEKKSLYDVKSTNELTKLLAVMIAGGREALREKTAEAVERNYAFLQTFSKECVAKIMRNLYSEAAEPLSK